MGHYSVVHAAAEERVVPIFMIMDERRILLSMGTYFYYAQATEKAVHGYRVNAGDVIRVKVWAIYGLLNNKMAKALVMSCWVRYPWMT